MKQFCTILLVLFSTYAYCQSENLNSETQLPESFPKEWYRLYESNDSLFLFESCNGDYATVLFKKDSLEIVDLKNQYSFSIHSIDFNAHREYLIVVKDSAGEFSTVHLSDLEEEKNGKIMRISRFRFSHDAIKEEWRVVSVENKNNFLIKVESLSDCK